jgi:hypothetical protein
MRDRRADLGLALDVLEREALGRVPDDVAVHEPCSVGVFVRICACRRRGWSGWSERLTRRRGEWNGEVWRCCGGGGKREGVGRAHSLTTTSRHDTPSQPSTTRLQGDRN